MTELKDLVNATLGRKLGGAPLTEDVSPGSGDDASTQAFLESLEASFKRRGADITPLLGLRAADVVSAWLNVGALEKALRYEGVLTRADEKTETQSSTEEDDLGPAKNKPKKPAKPNPLVETTAKAWDRLRKALKDLEAMLPEKPPMQSLGLPSLVAPLLEEAEGVLEDAVEFEERKKRRRARAGSEKRGNGQRSGALA